MPKISKTVVQQVEPVRGDATGAVLNGWPVTPYLPRDPWRRANLLAALNLTAGQLITEEN